MIAFLTVFSCMDKTQKKNYPPPHSQMVQNSSTYQNKIIARAVDKILK